MFLAYLFAHLHIWTETNSHWWVISFTTSLLTIPSLCDCVVRNRLFFFFPSWALSYFLVLSWSFGVYITCKSRQRSTRKRAKKSEEVWGIHSLKNFIFGGTRYGYRLTLFHRERERERERRTGKVFKPLFSKPLCFYMFVLSCFFFQFC